MAQRRTWPDELPDVFRGSQAVAEGVLTPRQLRDPRLRRLHQDAYAPAHVPLDHVLVCRGAALVAPPGARLTGRSLATVRGVPLVGATDRVEMVVPEALRIAGPRGVALRSASRGPLGTGTWRGVPVTTEERMGLDLTIGHHLEQAVAHLDAAARGHLLDLPRLRLWLAERHEDGIVAARAAADHADGRAASQPESRLRVRLVRAGLDVVPQHVVRTDGRFVARVDLALVSLRIAVEYEGAWHGLVVDQLARDRRRLDQLREAGWIVVHVTADMMRVQGMAEDAVRRAVAQRRPTWR